jgi:hypothetical protein
VLEGVVRLLLDPEIPVKYEAAITFRILSAHGTIPHAVTSAVPQVLDSMLELVQLCPNDDIVATLEALIDRFPAEVSPSAARVCRRLCQTFLAHAEGTMEDTSTARCRVLVATMSALVGLLQNLRDLPHMYSQLEDALLQVVHTVLSRQAEFAMAELVVDAVEVLALNPKPRVLNPKPETLSQSRSEH